MEKKSVAQEIREFADKLAQINPEVQELSMIENITENKI